MSTKSFFHFNEIWHVGTDRRVMHDSMQYDPIQHQGQGDEPFKSYLRIYSGSWQQTTDS